MCVRDGEGVFESLWTGEKRSWEHWGKVVCVQGLRRGRVGNTSEFLIREV